MKRSYKCFIIEDEPLAGKRIREMIQSRSNLSVSGYVDDIEDLYLFSDQLSACDILFLDLIVRGGSIDLLENYIVCLPYIVIISALPPHNYPSFLLNRKCFALRKPITINDFNQCIDDICAHALKNPGDFNNE